MRWRCAACASAGSKDGVAAKEPPKGALWRALTNRATPIPAGDPVRVAAIDGLVLEVEPLEGAAMDYREMRDRRKGADEDGADDGKDAGGTTK